MNNEPHLDRERAQAVATALEVMRDVAADRLRGLRIDPPEYVADLFCLDRAANMIALQAAMAQPFDPIFMVTVIAQSAEIGQILREAYARRQIDSRTWCLSLFRAAVQPHPILPSSN